MSLRCYAVSKTPTVIWNAQGVGPRTLSASSRHLLQVDADRHADLPERDRATGRLQIRMLRSPEEFLRRRRRGSTLPVKR
jgi:hypothetical protein